MVDPNEAQAPAVDTVLEEPAGAEIPDVAAESFFSDDLPVLTGKLMAVEAFLKLTVRDTPFQEFIRDILLVMVKAVKSEAGSDIECAADGSMFFRAAVGHGSDRVVRFMIPKGQGIAGHVAESRQPLIVGNVEADKTHLKAISTVVGFDARNMLAAPIVVRGKVFAVVELLNRVGEGGYSETDREVVNYLCEMAARAIEIRMMIAWSAQAREKKDKEEAA